MKIVNEFVVIIGVVAILGVALYYYQGFSSDASAVLSGATGLLKQAQNIQSTYPH